MTNSLKGSVNFHEASLIQRVFDLSGSWVTYDDVGFSYSFENFFHPFVGELIERLNRASLAGLLDPSFHEGLKHSFFDNFYTALNSSLVEVTAVDKEIDLAPGGPYANYNWELLFHVPLTVAVHLSKNQRFDEARRWFHLIFDPTSTDTSRPVPQRFWRFLAFRSAGPSAQIDEQLALLSKPDEECSAEELRLKGMLLEGYEAIRDRPFQPHAVARTRLVAYQYCVVMKYLDNLLAWGDSLFRQDTQETVNEATQLYILAANLLGQRPQRLPEASAARPRTYAELKQRTKTGFDAMSNALVELEGKFPLNLGAPRATSDQEAARPLFGIGRTLYFCIPRNEKLLGYWDTVADRLFKIRNCLNIEGVVRQLALFDPPLDPGMLVKAAAAGIDIGSVVGGLNRPVGPVRALFLLQKALELCAEVRNMGAALLAAVEKGDGERLALLRQGHELTIQQMQLEVRFLQHRSAREAAQSLLTSRRAAMERLRYYKRLLGIAPDENAPDELAIDASQLALNEANFDEQYGKLVETYDKALKRPDFPRLSVAGEGRARLHLTINEDDEFEHHKRARDSSLAASTLNALAAGFAPVPDADADFHFWGIGGKIKLNVGTALLAGAKIAAEVLNMVAAWERVQAELAAKTANYERRADEWLLQHNLAAHELMQNGRQILTALLAEQVAAHEYETTKRQIEQTQEADRFLQEKFSNQELYAWMQGECARLYYEYYRFAYDTAVRASQVVKHELMRPEVTDTDYIKFNYWDGGRKGLLAGEALYLDLKRLELAYHEHNRREYELTRHVSLRQLNPAALLELRVTGKCRVAIPEWLYDIETPGHYMRRIRSVALTIPCVAGPYTGVSCTLTLTKSTLRSSPELAAGVYERQEGEDRRFRDYFSGAQSVVTSSGQNDSGLFEVALRDERPLPFEGAGAESSWELEFPGKLPLFDYLTISDVIFHIRHTARGGGVQLRAAAETSLLNLLKEPDTGELALLFSLRHDFPTEWAAFTQGAGNFSAVIRDDMFPYLAKGREITITGCELYAPGSDGQLRRRMEPAGAPRSDEDQGFIFNSAADDAGPNRVLARATNTNVWLIVRYTLG